PFGERHLDDALVGLTGADDLPVVVPGRRPPPLPLFDDLWVRLLDQPAYLGERLPAPVSELLDSLIDHCGARTRLSDVFLHHRTLPARCLDAELRRVFGVQTLPALELHRLHAGDASDGLAAQQAIEHVEADVPASRAHRDEPAIDLGPEREARALAAR